MAKNNSNRSGAPSRIRFIMLDAELSDGDLSQVTQAIQNALAPMGKTPLRIVAPKGQTRSSDSGASESTEEETEVDESADDFTDEIEIKVPARPRLPRKARSPKVLELDLTNEVSLASFANSKKTDTDTARNLVIAAWFKMHRNTDAITVDHIYTCYRSLGWPTGIPDFGKPLKNLKQRQFFDGKDGNYAINHLGIARVENPEG